MSIDSNCLLNLDGSCGVLSGRGQVKVTSIILKFSSESPKLKVGLEMTPTGRVRLPIRLAVNIKLFLGGRNPLGTTEAS